MRSRKNILDKIRSNSVYNRDNHCREWTGAVSASKTPVMSLGRNRVSVRRQHWIAAIGPVADNQRVRSSCGNPLCVKLSHMHVTNQGDPIATPVAPPVANVRNHGISEEDIAQLREIWASSDHTQRALGVTFGVSQPTVSAIVNDKHHGPKRLDYKDAVEIRNLHAVDGWSITELAERYGVCVGSIRRLCTPSQEAWHGYALPEMPIEGRIKRKGKHGPRMSFRKASIVRELYAHGGRSNTIESLAHQFGVSTSTIHRILNQKIWTDDRRREEADKRKALKNNRNLPDGTFNVKLSREQADSIREQYAQGNSGISMRTLAANFGVSVSTISNVINGLTWKPNNDSNNDSNND